MATYLSPLYYGVWRRQGRAELIDLVCIGMSHVHSLQEGYLDGAHFEEKGVNLRTFILGHPPYTRPDWVENGRVVFSAEFDRDFMEYLGDIKPKAIFTHMTGAQHFHLSFLNSPRPYDFFLPDDPADRGVDAGAELIPYDLMFETCELQAGGMANWLGHLRELTDLPIYQIAMPPPVTGDEFLRAQTHGDLREQIERYGIAPEAIRSKVWEVCVRAVERQCAMHRAGVIPAPQAALDANRCLLTQYRGHDAVHANGAYGRLLIDQMAEIVRRHLNGDA